MPKWFHLPGRRAIGPLAMLWCRAAAATPEVLAPDARSTGLGATGVAFADDASATQHNPARLQAISRASFVVGLTGAWLHQEAPVLGPNQKSTSDIVAVFGMIGGAYRLAPRLVLGLSVLPASGSAGRYELPNGTEASAAVVNAEAQLAVSFALLDNLWLGVVYRPSYVRQDIKTPTPLRDGSVFESETTLDTFNFIGASAG
ncbi:MAG TPA: hypothetical protein VNO21_21230, partial [Polyangiaceae bacterium]|nr:hypothetical protein [Polyangiaceae bacterium]